MKTRLGSSLEPSVGDVSDAGVGLAQMSQVSMKDASPGFHGDVAEGLVRPCLWCAGALKNGQKKYCQPKCRKAAWRSRQLAVVEGLGDAPKRLAVADPPFVGLAEKYYKDEPSYRGEVDHADLVRRLTSGAYDGWALCCSRKSLRYVLSLVPAWVEPIVCTWTKAIHRSKARGIVNVVEHVIVVPARRRFPGVPDGLVCAVARGGDSKLIGRKPIKFVNWVFGLLGAEPCDVLDDLFPGSGIVDSCWKQLKGMGAL